MRTLVFLIFVFSFVRVAAQIDLQTGSAQYSIPVFSYADPQSGLSHSVAINYNSGQGIKVNQLSSNVGLDWSLMAGGEIIRIQRGSAPDDQYDPNVTVNGLTNAQAEYNIYKQDNPTLFDAYYPNGFLYKKYDINYLPKQIGFQPRFGDNDNSDYKIGPIANEDAEQDLFMVNIDGVIKEFKIGKDFSVKYEDNALWKTDITKEDITDQTLYSQKKIMTKIKGFIITDENGLKYTFDKYDIDEVQHLVPGTGGWSYYAAPNTSLENGTGWYVISKWLLTSITNPITNTSITFNYIQEDHQYFSDFLDQTSVDADNSNGTPSYSRIIGNSHTISNILQQISFPNGITVNFTQSATGRVDINGSFPLSKIEVSNGNKIIKTVNFSTAYFLNGSVVDGTGATPVKRNETLAMNMLNGYKYRLALTGLNVTGQSPSTYSFTYYIGNVNGTSYTVPSRVSKQRDFSGLYNPKYGLLGSANIPDAYGNYPSADGNTEVTGLLKDIQTSSNNKISYSYKLASISSVYYLKVVLVDKIIFSDLVANTSYTKAYGYCSSATANCTGTPSVAYPAFYDFTNTYIGLNSDLNHIQYNPSSNKKFGTYVINGLSTQVTSFLANWGSAVQLNGLIMNAFHCNPYVSVAIQIVGEEVVNILTGWLADIFNNHDQNLNFKVYYDHIRDLANPLPTTLAFVNEFDVVNNTNIRRKTYYFNTANFNNKILDNVNGQNVIAVKPPTQSGMQRVKPGLLGNLAEIDYYDPQGNTVYTKTNSYTPKYQTLDDNYLSVYYSTSNYYSGSRGLTPTPYLTGGAVQSNWINKTPYNFIIGNNYLTSETESISDLNHSAINTTTTNYTYNSKNNLPNQACTTASNGKIKGTNMYYATDYWDTYTSNSVLAKQKLNNLVNIPVAIISWYKTSAAATSYYVTGVTITDYDLTTLQVNSVKASTLQQPISITQSDMTYFDPYSTTTSWLTNVNFTYLQQNTYDNNLLVQSNLNDNSSVNCVVYDYNTYLPSAKIVNSTFTDVSYTSFESSNKDQLSYPDAGVKNDVTPVTGNYFYKLSSGNLTRAIALNSSQKYQVTLWAKTGSGTVTVNSSSGTAIIAKNGWTLYKYSFTGATSLTISGTAFIDEVRLCPAGAQISTYTYDPLIGITSTCDENNNIVYNEYDDAGRLSIVRDADKNIIKKMCYNNLYASTACTDYGNKQQTGFFYGSCGCTFSNNGVPYTVNANKYHSLISQDDADAQAWTEINANGQANANNHPSCSALSTQTIQYVNTTNDKLCITFTNKCTNQSYPYNLNANVTTATTITQLAGATYNVEIKNCANQSVHSFMVNNFTITGTNDAIFYNMQFSSATTFVIY